MKIKHPDTFDLGSGVSVTLGRRLRGPGWPRGWRLLSPQLELGSREQGAGSGLALAGPSLRYCFKAGEERRPLLFPLLLWGEAKLLKHQSLEPAGNVREAGCRRASLSSGGSQLSPSALLGTHRAGLSVLSGDVMNTRLKQPTQRRFNKEEMKLQTAGEVRTCAGMAVPGSAALEEQSAEAGKGHVAQPLPSGSLAVGKHTQSAGRGGHTSPRSGDAEELAGWRRALNRPPEGWPPFAAARTAHRLSRAGRSTEAPAAACATSHGGVPHRCDRHRCPRRFPRVKENRGVQVRVSTSRVSRAKCLVSALQHAGESYHV